MRKLFFLFLTLLATTTLWAHDFVVDGIYYNYLEDNNVAVTYKGNSYDDYNNEYSGAVAIPSTVTYNGTTYSVTSIRDEAFAGCSKIKSIVIPESIINVGYYICKGCTSLETVFWNATKCMDYNHGTSDNGPYSLCPITSFIFGNKVEHIPASLCRGLEKLTSITIPNSVTSIGFWAFRDCSSLTSVTIGNSVTSIGEGAFRECSSLTSVTIPNSVTSIGDVAFCNCSSLTSITIPNSVTSIGTSAFYGTGIYNDNSNWENNVLYISNCLIEAKESISGTYTIKENTQLIADHAFYNCSRLTSITIPNSVTSIGDEAFWNSSSLTSITIPNSVTSIGNSAFRGCSSLTSVTIPNSVTSIGDFAFYDCSSLTSITIPNSVTSIGYYAFRGCSSLTSVTIPNSVTSIGNGAFEGCSSLTSVTIGNSVTNIGEDPFNNCRSLTSIVVGTSNTTYDSRDNCNAIIETATNTLIIGCQNTTIPNSVTRIGNGAFFNCSSLTSIIIPNSVTSIGYQTFSFCSSLISITIPNSVTSIGRSAFYRCSSLTSITIPNSVMSIGEEAFSYCSSLSSIVVETGNTTYDSRDKSNAIIETATNTLVIGCKNTIIPNSVTSIGDGAFDDCTSLTSITIPNSVTSIGRSAFSGCTSLTSITIPNSVTSIGYHAFYKCSSLTSITCEAIAPPTIDWSTFRDISESIPVYIPCGTISAYNTAQYWNEFTNFQEPLAEYSINVSTANSRMGTAKVDFNNCAAAQISATANYRYNFVQWSDGNTDNPRTLVLTQDTTFTAEFAQAYSGQCGDSLYWEYDSTNKTISITGSGDMYNYTADTQPWLLFKEEIAEVTISNTATSIGTSAFEGCIRLGKVSIGTATKNIAANAFATCTKLYDIYCLAAEPPTGYTSSFANYNAFLHVPCESQRLYMLDILFGEFKYIECIASDEVPTDDIVITPGSTDVTIIWPTEGNADTYTIVIKKDGEVVCTLTFNSEGQLLNIAFAPGRDGNYPAQYAEQAGKGYRFTVTGLEEGVDYTYDITVKDASSKTIKSYAGEFTTGLYTAVDNITTDNANTQKLLRDGQLLIIRDGKTYTIMGAEL